MSDARAKELLDLGSNLFSTKLPYDTLCQEIAVNFYPERADFIYPLILGQEFSSHLADSFPIIARRDLGNSLSAMLRPRDKPWFMCSTGDVYIDRDPDNAKFLEYLTNCTRSAMYDVRTHFIDATKIGDHDFSTFGLACISVEEASSRDHIYYKAHHIRDIAYLENELGEVDHLHRKDKMTSRQLGRRFKRSELSKEILTAIEKEPNRDWPIRIVAMPSDEYDSFGSDDGDSKMKRKHPFVVIYLDESNGKVIRESQLAVFPYVIPRWHKISGTQYAFSQAAMSALPDGRMAQALSQIILEAGEKQINPPIVAREEVIRDASLQAGAITWADAEYDTPLKDHIMPLALGADMKTAFTMQQGLRDILKSAFFNDKLALPEPQKDMTAYEVAQRLEEHVRNLLPIFEPMESEYNGKILDKTFAVLRNMGHYDFSQMSDGLRKLKSPVMWRFVNPMQQVSDRIRVEQFQECIQLEQATAQAAQLMGKPYSPRTDLFKARDMAVMQGTGAPASWFRDDAEIQQDQAQQQQDQQMQQLAGLATQGSQIASQVADASQRVGQAMLPPGQQKPMAALPPPKQQKPQKMPQIQRQPLGGPAQTVN